MKIKLSDSLQQWKHRLIVAGVALLLVASVGQQAHAQGGLLQYLSPVPSKGLSNGRTAKKPTLIANAGKNYRVMSASAAQVRTAADSKRTSSVRAAGGFRGKISAAVHQQSPKNSAVKQTSFLGGCSACDTSSCDGGCASGACGGGSCGGSGGYNISGMGRYVSGGGFTCGTYCEPYRFLTADALYMERRGEENYTLSQNFGMDEFDFEWGLRFTAGYVPDCVNGYEVTFTGPFEWDMSGALLNTPGGINTLLIPGNPIAPASLSTFNNAVFQSQNYNAEFWSLEANKTIIGWDVVKLLLGARYIDYSEDYDYFTQNAANETGLLQNGIDNQMFGAQIGLDLLYPVGRFAYADFRSRAGLYLNFAESSVGLANAGAVVLSNQDEDEEIAGFFELGSGFRYHLGEALTVRGGTELWYLTGVATVPDQVGQVITPVTGRQIAMDDDIFFYGLVASIEIRL